MGVASQQIQTAFKPLCQSMGMHTGNVYQNGAGTWVCGVYGRHDAASAFCALTYKRSNPLPPIQGNQMDPEAFRFEVDRLPLPKRAVSLTVVDAVTGVAVPNAELLLNSFIKVRSV